MRLVLFISVPFVLFLSLLLLFGADGSTPTVQAQAVDGASDRQLFLPIIRQALLAPTPPPIKAKSGIHLGNRYSSDWRIELFEHITGTMAGTWPSAVVIRSDQVFNLYRYITGQCRIAAAGVKLTGEGEPYNAFKYLDAAIKAGTKIVIRIAPSPGNFVDYQAPGGNHGLLIDETPAGGNYCDESASSGLSTSDKLRAFRDIREIAEEMSAIYTLTVGTHDWPAERLYFEPANEPNQEWYGGSVIPKADNRDAWIAMDNYFAALYDLAKDIESNLQILTPSMAQDLHGEQYFLGTCDLVPLVGGDGQGGMNFMTKTFGLDLAGNPLTPKADGFAIHNYWREGGEIWLPPPPDQHTVVPVIHFHCQVHSADPNYKPPTFHLLQYLSKYLLETMRQRPIFITEADLLSYCQKSDNPIQYKDSIPAVPDYTARTAHSLATFIDQADGRSEPDLINYGADYVIVWLLINQAADEANACRDGENNLYNNHEINWHEAYREDADHVYEREWFGQWWAITP